MCVTDVTWRAKWHTAKISPAVVMSPGVARDEIFAGDEAHVFVHYPNEPIVENNQLRSLGYVYLVMGNDGWDVISDYTLSLERMGLMKSAEAISDRYA